VIQITRSLARQIRAVLRKSAPLGSPRNHRPSLVLHAGQDGLRVQSAHPEVALEFHLPSQRPTEALVLPSSALDDFEGRLDTVVELTLKNAGTVQARWEEGSAPQCRDYAAISLDKLPSFPGEPKKFVSLDASFLKALDDAVQTAGRTTVRLPLTRLQLRGKSGEIASTDSRQLLVQRGFPFPWKDDILIPAVGVFGCRELLHDGRIAIGRSETHVCIHIGPWKFFLAIDKDGRYPRIDRVIPSRSRQGTTLHLAPEDASFLGQALLRLPNRDDEQPDVTVDLNGHVAIRGREEGSRVTEWSLSRSHATGPPVRFVSNRQLLAQAAKLGFTEFHVASPDATILCRDRHRIYVWVPLNPESAIPPTADAIRIESAANLKAVSQDPSPSRRPKAMPTPTTNGHATNGSPLPSAGRSERGQSIVDLITETEELRTVVLDASVRLARLLSGLKQHRRQSRAVQAAMQSLKQLRLDA
jgi:hypothetical protein